jgi:hypothetical protein
LCFHVAPHSTFCSAYVMFGALKAQQPGWIVLSRRWQPGWSTTTRQRPLLGFYTGPHRPLIIITTKPNRREDVFGWISLAIKYGS